jgi:protein phosphatase
VASVSRNTGKEPVKIFKEAIRKANDLLIAEAREDETKNGMGTTLVAATIIGHRLFVANVGDSRLYVISDRIRQITKDHSLVEEMVRLGEMAESEARKHPRKNIITRAIGAADQVEADFFEVELGEKDTILLCSDGLTNMVEDSAIEEIIFAKENVETKVNTLIQNANANGGRDNITATIIEPFSDEVKTC